MFWRNEFHQANLSKPWNYTWKALVPTQIEEREENMLNEIQSCNENAESRKKVLVIVSEHIQAYLTFCYSLFSVKNAVVISKRFCRHHCHWKFQNLFSGESTIIAPFN